MNKNKKMNDLKLSCQFVRQYDSGILKWMMLKSFVNSVSIYFNAVSLGLIIDSVTTGELREGMTMVLVVAVVNALIALINVGLGRYINYHRFFTELNYKQGKMEAFLRVPYARMETEEFQDLRQNIRFSDDNMGTFQSLMNNFERLFSNCMNLIVGCAVILGMLIRARVWEGKLLLVTVPMAGVIWGIYFGFMRLMKKAQDGSNAKTSVLFQKMTQGNRLALYLAEHIVHNYNMGKDVRVYQAGSMINREYKRMIRDMGDTYKKIGFVTGLPGTINTISSCLLNGILYLVLAVMAILHYIKIGDVIIWANSIGNVLGTYSGIVMCMGEFSILQTRLSYTNELFAIAGNREESLDEQKSIVQSPVEITFENVSFRYPNSDRWALKNINLTIRKGDRISIVGRNGAGKSTVVKLLCGLYEPDEGRILFDGHIKEEIGPARFQKMIAAVFQDFRLFAFFIEDNILMGKECNDNLLDNTIQKCNLKNWISGLRTGTDTFLFHDYEDGVECSGGEAQKIALARCYYASTPIMIFDEPTAALDARTEMEVFENMREISEDKTAIFVSHRLSACLFSNRIFVFQDGELIQEGTHEELVKADGSVYQELWRAQAQYYV